MERIAEDAKVEVDEASVERRLQELAQSMQRQADEIRHAWVDTIRDQIRRSKTIDHVLALSHVIDEERKEQGQGATKDKGENQ